MEQSERCLRDLIEYCGKKGISLLLVESPYIIQNENDIAETNTVSDIAKEYSVPFLNYNAQEMYETLDLDFATDIYDCNHVNCLGAKKFTEHIAPYMKENYSLDDHRESEEYASWDSLYTEKYLPYMTEYVRAMTEKALGVEQTLEKGPRIRATEDIVEWLSLIKDPNITLLYSYTPFEDSEVRDDIYTALYALDIEQSESCVGVCTDGKVSVYTDRQSFSGEIDMPTGIPDLSYSVALNKEDSVVSVGETEYRHKKHKGIHVVAFNNNTSEVVDTVLITCERGKTELIHIL